MLFYFLNWLSGLRMKGLRNATAQTHCLFPTTELVKDKEKKIKKAACLHKCLLAREMAEQLTDGPVCSTTLSYYSCYECSSCQQEAAEYNKEEG